jgi:N-acetylglucosaminyldiphosphoundecaprenol N-acetyl-beta-D-mannosaminyltransferase
MSVKNWPSFKILGIKVDFPTLTQALNWVSEQIKYNKVCQITTPNPEQLVLAQDDPEFRQILNRADLAICDGVGLLWAAKWFKSKSERQAAQKLQRLTGVDLMIALCQLASKRGWRVMLLGGKDKSAALAAEKLKTNNHKLKIATEEGSKRIVLETPEERERVIKKINAFRPQLLFVAYGAPWQEKWLASNLSFLRVNVVMGVGGAFDYLAGRVRRAPAWLRNWGLEWFWRLLHEPWRIKRQMALFKFLWLLLSQQNFQTSGQKEINATPGS